ncbi:Flavone 3'-O-methyltransferase 1 [Spatholobus suberectus]|nr:Flavone 3'-O-methyltransferase 1 [Spatholobus suberectus]
MMSVPMSLIAVINLKVPEAIWQDGSNAPLSAAQILDRIRPHGGGDAENLQRVLRLLTSYDIFVEHLCGSGQRKYSLADVGKTLVDDHQESPIEYYVKRPTEMALYYKSMAGMCVPFMREMLEVYDGFQGVETLVDVGGNFGVTLRMIMDKYPNVRKGINYDLPGIVASAPDISGVTHVGGNAFESVPLGDAIFVKLAVVAITMMVIVVAMVVVVAMTMLVVAGDSGGDDGDDAAMAITMVMLVEATTMVVS